jgi:fatty-acyl-CoA synthase
MPAPKGIALTHANLSANINAINGPAGMATTSDLIGVSWLPLNHDMGLIGMALGALYARCRSVMLPPSLFVRRPIAWLRTISKHRGNVSFAPNFAYDQCVRRIKDSDLERLDLSCWLSPDGARSPFMRRPSPRSLGNAPSPVSARRRSFRATVLPSTSLRRRSQVAAVRRAFRPFPPTA